jgi:hypothetical protein
MRWIQTCIAITVELLILAGCSSSNFMVYKDGSNFYVTSNCTERKRILCDSGDIDIIVKDSGLPDSLQKALKDNTCATSKEKGILMVTLEGMTNVQITALKDAFRRNGYEINRTLDA